MPPPGSYINRNGNGRADNMPQPRRRAPPINRNGNGIPDIPQSRSQRFASAAFTTAKLAEQHPIRAYLIVGTVFLFLIALPINIWGLKPIPIGQDEQYEKDTRITVICVFTLLGLFAYLLAFIKHSKIFCN